MLEINDNEIDERYGSVPRGFTLSGFGAGFHDEICDMLESTQMFKRLQSKHIAVLSEYCVGYDVEEGVKLLTEGEVDPHMFLLIKGKLKVSKRNDDNSESVIATILPGKTIGEMSLIDGQTHSASVITTTPCKVLMLGRGALNRLARNHPRVALEVVIKIAQVISNRLRQTSGKLVDFL
ncbi:MAG: cyclic nucleotide-binding domain-containing protein [Gammaproteobacteria bacterium]|nr:cyclic nucleotide-binding domain-containing protein [Gammaproteobacteria bacterium]